MRPKNLSFLTDSLKSTNKFDLFDDASNSIVDFDLHINRIDLNLLSLTLITKEMNQPTRITLTSTWAQDSLFLINNFIPEIEVNFILVCLDKFL